MKPIIHTKEAWKVFKMGTIEVPALRGLNVEIFPKELVVIMGPSGSGKSTAMNIVGCLDLPTKGTVLLDGKDISKMTESELARVRGKKIGFVFQKFNLIPSLTALENVTLPMTFQDVLAENSEHRAEKLLRLVGLGDRMNHRPTELSGGEQQRVAVARALANDPEIILADEPTGNLDSESGAMIMNLLQDLHTKEKKTVIIVTHDERFTKLKNLNKIYILKDGVVERTTGPKRSVGSKLSRGSS